MNIDVDNITSAAVNTSKDYSVGFRYIKVSIANYYSNTSMSEVNSFSHQHISTLHTVYIKKLRF